MTVFTQAQDAVKRAQPLRIVGTIASVRGLVVLVDELPLPVGALVSVRSIGRDGGERSFGEVVGFNRDQSIVMMLSQTTGIRAGDRVIGEQASQSVGVGPGLLGRVVNGLCQPIDGKGPIRDTIPRPLSPEPIPALQRRRITEKLLTGVRAVDLMTTLGRGQRMGLFAGPGVGKSTLMGTIAQRTQADVNVIALIGERGREVKDFIEHALGESGLARSVVIVATGDESPVLRLRASKLACTAAEFFRDCGLDVMLMMDSITRFAHAQRQVGLSVGEPPATKGYTPSVFANMALLLERAGCVDLPGATRKSGSITGLYTILVEGDDMTEPVADAARGILDGHIILSRKLAQRAHYPAIDVLDSVSRVAEDVIDSDHSSSRRQVLKMLAVYREVEDLVQIGAYAKGSNPEADAAIDANRSILALLQQGRGDITSFEQSRSTLLSLAKSTSDVIARALKTRSTVQPNAQPGAKR